MTAKPPPQHGMAAESPPDNSWNATILHIDMDAFFLSVELLDRPDLVGVPAVVAHEGPRSVITSASYEARAFGIRSAMPLAHARALCPAVRVLEPHREKYTAASAELTRIWTSYTPLVERISIDEAFLDVSGARRLLGSPAQIAHQIKEDVRQQLGLPSTVGVAANKSVAKIVSTHAKPDGLRVVPPEETVEYLAPLPVNVIWGVGPKLAERFAMANITTVGDLAAQDPEKMRRWIGVIGPQLVDLARGIDPRPVVPEHDAKSVGVEHTFDEDVTSVEELHKNLLDLSYECARRMRADGVRARGISVKVKDQNRVTRTKSMTLPESTASGARIAQLAQSALAELMRERWHPIRLLGVRGERIVTEAEVEHAETAANAQGELFDLTELSGADGSGGSETSRGATNRGKNHQPDKSKELKEQELRNHERTDSILDSIAERFPGVSLKPASLINHIREEHIGEDSD